MILFINGLQDRLQARMGLRGGIVLRRLPGRPWPRTASLSIPCFERRYGGVMEDELLMAIPPRYLPGVLDGLAALSATGCAIPSPTA